MSEYTITITVKGVPHYFYGDDLTSPEQQAIIFLRNKDAEKEVF